MTPIASSISPAEADVLQARLSALGCSMTIKPADPALEAADPALKAANPTKIHVPKKKRMSNYVCAVGCCRNLALELNKGIDTP